MYRSELGRGTVMIDSRRRLSRIVLPSLFAALIGAGAFMAFPLPGLLVPIVLQNLLVVLAGLLLGPLQGGAAVLLFLVLGALGFPVFSGGHGGLAWFAGPTGGYLFGYLAAAPLAGFIAKGRRVGPIFVASFASFALILLIGALRLKFFKNMGWEAAFLGGILPFVIGDSVKALLAALLTIRLGPWVDRLKEGLAGGRGATER